MWSLNRPHLTASQVIVLFVGGLFLNKLPKKQNMTIISDAAEANTKQQRAIRTNVLKIATIVVVILHDEGKTIKCEKVKAIKERVRHLFFIFFFYFFFFYCFLS